MQFGVLAHFAGGRILGLGVLAHARLKYQARKIDKIHKHIKFLCMISCGRLFEYCQYVLFTKRIETFWFSSFSNTRNIRTYCFKHVKVFILVEMYQIRKEKKLSYSQRFLNYIKCHKDLNTLKMYKLKALLSKN